MMQVLEWLSKYGVWNLIQIVLAIAGLIWTVLPRKKIDNLVFFARIERNNYFPAYPLRLLIEINNRTDRNIVVSNMYFVPLNKEFRAHPTALRNTSTDEYVCNFPEGPKPDGKYRDWNQTDYILRQDETVKTYVPLHPDLPDETIMALCSHNIGVLHCRCTWVEMILPSYKLVQRMKPEYAIS